MFTTLAILLTLDTPCISTIDQYRLCRGRPGVRAASFETAANLPRRLGYLAHRGSDCVLFHCQ